MKRFFFTFLLFFSFIVSKNLFAADPYIKVHILSRYHLGQVKVTSSLAKLKILEKGKVHEALWPPGTPLILKAVNNQVEVRWEGSARKVEQVYLEPPRGSFLTFHLATDLQKRFPGRITVRNSQGSLFFVEELPLEDYVRSVLESEVPYDFPLEALKAQAVVVRTFALAHLDRHKKEGFHLCDLTHCQVYGGLNLAYRVFEQAAKQTQSKILIYEMKAAETPYHSTCGGHTSAYHRVFGGKMIPYLMGVNDGTYCSKSPHSQWDSSISLKILEEILKKDVATHPKGEIYNLRPAEREEKGRIFALALEGKRNFVVPVTQFMSIIGRYLGWSKIKSNWFEVEVKDGEAHFLGRGLGHGVGFCQWGARGMAEQGKKYDEILSHYFPGVQMLGR